LKNLNTFILIILISAAVSCGGHKGYSDVKLFINEVAAAQDEFLSLAEKSANAEDMIYAVNGFGDKLVHLSEKSVEIKKKYPDVEKWVIDSPAELKSEMEKLHETESRFEKVFFNENLKNIIKDQKVQIAIIELSKKMGSVKFF